MGLRPRASSRTKAQRPRVGRWVGNGVKRVFGAPRTGCVRQTTGLALAAAVLFVAPTIATASPLETVQVTATRVPEPVDRIPADVSVVSAADLVLRDATTMAGALALVPGVEAPPGGDAGPSSAVPSFWGLHEFDAFLLAVDGVPWGGAFNPSIPTLDFNNVARVEVLKGAAPVMFGATAFVGVVQVLHYPAGESSNLAELAAGNFGSARGAAAFVLPELGGIRQSLALDAESLGFADRRERVSDGQFLYRGAADLGAGTLAFDAGVSIVRDAPPSPVLRDGAGLTSLSPIDANFNPADAAIDQNQVHGALGYTLQTGWGEWTTLLSWSHSDVVDIRAFLHPDLSGTADTQNQHRAIDDGYFDTHLSRTLGPETTLILGADLLYGLGRQTTRNANGAYTVPLDGSVLPPPTSALSVNEFGTLSDHRVFAGQYAQLDVQPFEDWDVIAGIRLNETYEHKHATDLDLTAPPLVAQSANKVVVRPAGTIGASYRFWSSASGEAVLYADYRNAFKPAAIDFGPDFTPDILNPETAQSYEAGMKGSLLAGRLVWETEAFLENFQNLVVPTSSGALANAAGERLQGAEAELELTVIPDLTVDANAAWHDARFTHYDFFDGVSVVDVKGRELPLAPQFLAALGVLYAPREGLNASFVANYVGPRFLDEENTAPVAGYVTFDATLGYRLGRYALFLEGTNLSDQRPPVTASEFGSESFYLLPARTVRLRLTRAL